VASANYGVVDVVKVVGADPAVTATLLRYGNSAMWRGASPITTLQSAVTRIGVSEVLKVAMAATLGAASARHGVLAELRRKAWQQSLTGAFLPRRPPPRPGAFLAFLVARGRGLNPQEGFTCGLLHDFGRIVSIICLEDLLGSSHDARALTEEDWLSLVDEFHVDLGLLTARIWGLPPLVKAAIGTHHEPENAGIYRPMVDVLVVVDEVLKLLDERPALGTEDLEGMGLRPGEPEAIIGGLAGIGAFVAGLDEATPRPPGPEPVSQVHKPSSTLPTPNVAVDFPALIQRGQTSLAARCTRLSWGALAFTVNERLPACYLVRVRLEPPGHVPFELQVQVSKASAEAHGVHTEAKLFVTADPAKTSWLNLVKAHGLRAISQTMAAYRG
jgi:HD-like signal output (HDOD) protein